MIRFLLSVLIFFSSIPVKASASFGQLEAARRTGSAGADALKAVDAAALSGSGFDADGSLTLTTGSDPGTLSSPSPKAKVAKPATLVAAGALDGPVHVVGHLGRHPKNQ